MPVGIGRVRVIAAAFGLSLLAGLVAATILRQLNNTVNTTEEVESRLGVGLLSALPKLGLLAGRKISRAVDLQPTSGFSEAIRTAVTGIAMSSLDSPRKIVAVTSTLPDEGKSTTAENLALFNAKMKPTVLVEADLRKPVIAESLELARNGPARPGLSELLAGMASLDDCLQSVDGSELKVIAAGIIPPNPLEMVSSMAFGRVIAELSERFEMVIIDTPPIQPVSDVLMISKHVTGVVYVVKSNVTPVPMIRRSLKRLAEAGAPLIGIVLNQHDYRKAERYYGEYSGYGRYGYKDYYGGGYGKSRRKASGPSKRVDGPVPSDQGGKAA
jgi:capsular exopolysaccharide synthesis family protein